MFGSAPVFVSLSRKSRRVVLTDFEVVRIGFAVDQVRPIEVAFGCPFPSGERTEDDKACVLGWYFRISPERSLSTLLAS